MPNATFFRLPQEKRDRLIHAATEEFTRVAYAEASINQIIQGANIPRGSFYQYFTDKEDLFFFLIDTMRNGYIDTLFFALQQAEGDVFDLPLRMFDLLVEESGAPVPALRPCVQILKLNQGMDIHGLLIGRADQILPQIFGKIDRKRLARQDDSYVDSVFHLLVFALVTAMVETLWGNSTRETQRAILCDRIEIIRNGSINSAGAGEETT